MKSLTRRSFLGKMALGLGSALFAGLAIVSGQNLNSKIRLACIGVGGKGYSDVKESAACGMEIAALCDVDDMPLLKMAAEFPVAAKFKDFREMLEKMDKDIYCQKPLTQTVWESRVMRDLARGKQLATQMGNQACAGDGLRRTVEVIHAGVIVATSLLLLGGEKQFASIDKHEACIAIPESIPRSPGHYKEWFDAINGGPQPYSNFETAACLNEIILLGSITQQLGEGRPMDWDGPNMKSTNLPEASALVKRQYRQGWEPAV